MLVNIISFLSSGSKFLIALVFLLYGVKIAYSDCAMLNNCNGHGRCDAETSSCNCFEGWGSTSDITLYRAPDCSARTCPAGKAWADVPTSSTVAHKQAECSNRGSCDRVTGECDCFPGFTGAACQRTACPNDCSGHGVCVSIKQMARMSNALPLGPNTYYEGDEVSCHMRCVCHVVYSLSLFPLSPSPVHTCIYDEFALAIQNDLIVTPRLQCGSVFSRLAVQSSYV
jgi:hypothetical protein